MKWKNMKYLEKIKEIENNHPELLVNLTQVSSAYITNLALYNTNNLDEKKYLESKKNLEETLDKEGLKVDFDKFATELVTYLYDNRSR
jgi:alpha-L-arabinofuranosidase